MPTPRSAWTSTPEAIPTRTARAVPNGSYFRRRLGDGGDEVEPGLDGTTSIVLVRRRIAEAGEDAVADEPVHVAAERRDRRRAGELVVTDDAVRTCSGSNRVAISVDETRSANSTVS